MHTVHWSRYLCTPYPCCIARRQFNGPRRGPVRQCFAHVHLRMSRDGGCGCPEVSSKFPEWHQVGWVLWMHAYRSQRDCRLEHSRMEEKAAKRWQVYTSIYDYYYGTITTTNPNLPSEVGRSCVFPVKLREETLGPKLMFSRELQRTSEIPKIRVAHWARSVRVISSCVYNSQCWKIKYIYIKQGSKKLHTIFFNIQVPMIRYQTGFPTSPFEGSNHCNRLKNITIQKNS